MRKPIRVHFLHWHVWDTLVILCEGNFSQPSFPHCNMLVPWRAMNGGYLSTAQCARGEERKQRRLVEEELWETSERACHAYG